MQKELIDILDKESYLKGEIKVIESITKEEAHKTGKFHLAGQVWIYNSRGEVLLQKRAKNKDSHPGLYDISAAGHISAGETMNEGILRELKEELGEGIEKALKTNQFELIFTYTENSKTPVRSKIRHNNEGDSVYLLKFDGKIEDLTMQEEEIEELKFISIEQFEQEINDPKFKEKYVPHRQEYFQKVLSELKKRLKN